MTCIFFFPFFSIIHTRIKRDVGFESVVFDADLIIERFRLLWTDLINAASPVMCGQGIDIPDFMLIKYGFYPIGTFPGSVLWRL